MNTQPDNKAPLRKRGRSYEGKYKSKDEAIKKVRSFTQAQIIEAQNRLTSNVFHSPDGCWYWLGGTGGGRERSVGKQYGRFHIAAYTWQAHRISYELFIGPIPSELLACHHCDNPLCVNPHHIFLGTTTDNQRDFHRKGRKRRPRNAHKSAQL